MLSPSMSLGLCKLSFVKRVEDMEAKLLFLLPLLNVFWIPIDEEKEEHAEEGKEEEEDDEAKRLEEAFSASGS